MRLTERQLRSIYVMLISSPPFNKWHLPDEYRIQFKVNKMTMSKGFFNVDPLIIVISMVTHTGLMDVVETMAHEMVHLYGERTGNGGHEDHNEKFKDDALEVCKVWGFDPSTF